MDEGFPQGMALVPHLEAAGKEAGPHRALLNRAASLLRMAHGHLEEEQVLYQRRCERVWELEGLCAIAYQFAGSVDGPVALLDNLAAAAQGEPLKHPADAGIPFASSPTDEGSLADG